MEPPIKIPSMKLAVQWHNSAVSDAAVLCVVDILKELAGTNSAKSEKRKS